MLRGVDERGREVALKLGVRASEREALLSAQGLSGVVELLDEGEHEGKRLLVLPWYEQDLRSWLQTDPGLVERLQVLRKVAVALEALHTRQLHGDLKPSNILLRPVPGAWELVLADLGGQRTEEGARFTRSYAPPEQQLPLIGAPGPSWDLHALGATAYELLTGRLPDALLQREALFTTEALRLRQRALEGGCEALPLEDCFELERAAALLPGDRARLRAGLEDLGAEPDQIAALQAWIQRALEPDPRRREATLADLLGLLGPPEVARPPRRWKMLPLGAGLVLLLTAVVVSAAGQEAPTDPGPPVEEAPTEALASAEEPALEEGPVPEEAEPPRPVREGGERAPAQQPPRASVPPSGPVAEEEPAAEGPEWVELRFLHASSAVFEVWLDGEEVGRQARVVTGRHQLELRASGRRACKQEIEVGAPASLRCLDDGSLDWLVE